MCVGRYATLLDLTLWLLREDYRPMPCPNLI